MLGHQSVRVSPKEILARYLTHEEMLEKEGKLVAKCPFHRDIQGWSARKLIMYLDTGKWECSGCGLKGDIPDFVSQAEGISRKKAIDLLANWQEDDTIEP